MAEEFDPEMLNPVEKIRYAEQMIRSEHRVLDGDWLFWREVADHLNMIAQVPGWRHPLPRDWRAFNRAQDMATGYIRMSAAQCKLCGGTGRVLALWQDSDVPTPWRPGSYADGVVQPCPRGHRRRRHGHEV